MPNDFRTAPRYFVLTALPATLGTIGGNVVDLSARGARLHLTEPLALGAVLRFTLCASGETIDVQATVSWCRIAALALDESECDRYLCGIMFDSEQAGVVKVIDDLVAAEHAMRIEDARGSERYEITTQLTGSFGMHSPVRILDLSIRGARIA